MNQGADAQFESELQALAKLESIQADVAARFKARDDLANPQNLKLARQSHQDNKKSLKSDVKKTAVFVNKLRSINSEALAQCVRDVDALNLTLYVSEIVTALSEVSFKPQDVPAIVKLCCALHKRYEEFAPSLLDRLKQSMLTPLTSANDENNLKKRRIQIRLIVELFDSGFFVEEDFFISLMKLLTGKSNE